MEFKKFITFSETIDDIAAQANNLGKMPCGEIEKLMRINTDPISFGHFQLRRSFVKRFSWSIPCKEAIDAIKRYIRPPLHDLMAGTGFWAKLLNQEGIKTIPYDLHISKKYNRFQHAPTHMPIKRGHALKTAWDMQMRKIPGDVMISWPPYECPVATDVLSLLSIGCRIVYIGEEMYGCTGDLSFHKFLNKNCKELTSVKLPQFEGIHDNLYIYEKIKDDNIDPKYRGIGLPSYDWSKYDDDD